MANVNRQCEKNEMCISKGFAQAQFPHRIRSAVEQQSPERSKILIDSVSSLLLNHWLQFLRGHVESMYKAVLSCILKHHYITKYQ